MKNAYEINKYLSNTVYDKDSRQALLNDPLRFLKELGIPFRSGTISSTNATPKNNNIILGAYRP